MLIIVLSTGTIYEIFPLVLTIKACKIETEKERSMKVRKRLKPT